MSRTKSLTEKDHLVSQHHRRPLFFSFFSEDVKNWSKSFVKMKDFSNFGLNFCQGPIVALTLKDDLDEYSMEIFYPLVKFTECLKINSTKRAERTIMIG